MPPAAKVLPRSERITPRLERREDPLVACGEIILTEEDSAVTDVPGARARFLFSQADRVFLDRGQVFLLTGRQQKQRLQVAIDSATGTAVLQDKRCGLVHDLL